MYLDGTLSMDLQGKSVVVICYCISWHRRGMGFDSYLNYDSIVKHACCCNWYIDTDIIEQFSLQLFYIKQLSKVSVKEILI